MRSLHADLLSKIGGDIDPAIRLVFTSQDGGTTYDYSFDPTSNTNRAENLTLRLEPFDEYCQIQLRNDDLAVPSLVGYYIDLGLGANTDSGLRYGDYPRLWVKQQHTLSGGSKNGKKDLKILLELEGVWNILKEQLVLIGTAPFHNDNFGNLTGKTIYGVLKYLIETSLYSLTGSIFQFTLDALGDQDDGAINSFVPEPVKNPEIPFLNKKAPERYETFIEVFESLLVWTGSYLLARDNLTFKIIYPQSTDAVQETYYSSLSDGHVFYEHTEDEYVKRPNRVITYSDLSEDKDWSTFVSGNAYDPDEWDLSTGTYTGEYMNIIRTKVDSEGLLITSSARADTWAAFLLDKYQAETFGGRIVVPFDPRIELFDRAQTISTRGI